MKNYWNLAATPLLILFMFTGHAIALTAVKPVNDLVCMDLNLPESVLRDRHGNGLPLVYEKPSETSKIIGNAGGMIFAVKPVRQINGFIEYVRPNWQHGWVKQEYLKPHTGFECIPSLMSDGGLGF